MVCWYRRLALWEEGCNFRGNLCEPYLATLLLWGKGSLSTSKLASKVTLSFGRLLVSTTMRSLKAIGSDARMEGRQGKMGDDSTALPDQSHSVSQQHSPNL